MRLIPFYFAFTAAILALFITIEAPGSDIESLGAGRACGIIFGIFFGVLAIAYIFFMPFFERKLIHKDTRLRVWHIPLGPLLRRENPPLYFPGKGDEYVTNYYEDAYGNVGGHSIGNSDSDDPDAIKTADASGRDISMVDSEKGSAEKGSEADILAAAANTEAMKARKSKYVSPYDRWVVPVQNLSWANPTKLWSWTKFIILRGVKIDCISHDSELLRTIHAKANRYDVRCEHLWTYCQVISAMLMSIAHGSNDIANAVGPISAVYSTWRAGEVSTENGTPIWLLVIGGILLGLGFWFYGYHIIRALGNKITQMSPTRGFSIELGAAITVLMASRLGLPVSTTQCLTGAAVGVAMMNYDLGAVNWRQVAFIFMGWVLTLPCAGLVSGLLCLMALNAPSF